MTTRKTAPSVTNPIMPWLTRKLSPYKGLKASSTEGFRAMCSKPAPAIAMNQTSVIGPKNAATLRGAARLHGKQRYEDHDRYRNDIGIESRRRDFQTFDRPRAPTAPA